MPIKTVDTGFNCNSDIIIGLLLSPVCRVELLEFCSFYKILCNQKILRCLHKTVNNKQFSHKFIWNICRILKFNCVSKQNPPNFISDFKLLLHYLHFMIWNKNAYSVKLKSKFISQGTYILINCIRLQLGDKAGSLNLQ